MAREQPESRTVRKIRRYLESFGAEVIKVHGGAFSRTGEGDLLGCFRGRTFAIEVKDPDEDHPVSPAQRYRLLRWARAGARVGVAQTPQEALDIMTGGKGIPVVEKTENGWSC